MERFKKLKIALIILLCIQFLGMAGGVDLLGSAYDTFASLPNGAWEHLRDGTMSFNEVFNPLQKGNPFIPSLQRELAWRAKQALAATEEDIPAPEINPSAIFIGGIQRDIRTATVVIAGSTSLNRTHADIYCDNTNDQVQINAMGGVGRRIVLLDGPFTIGATGIATSTNSVLQGQGKYVTVITQQALTATDGMIEIGGDGCELRDFTLNGNKNIDDFYWGVGINGRDNGLIQNVLIKDIGDTAHDRWSVAIRFHTAASDNWTLIYVDLIGNTDCGIYTTTVAVTNVKVRGGYYYNNAGGGPTSGHIPIIYIGPGCSGWTVSGGLFVDNYYASVGVYGEAANQAHDITLSDLTTINNLDADSYRLRHCWNVTGTNLRAYASHGGILAFQGDVHNSTIVGFAEYLSCDSAISHGAINFESRDNLTPHDIEISVGTIQDHGLNANNHYGIFFNTPSGVSGYNIHFSHIDMIETRGAGGFFNWGARITGGALGWTDIDFDHILWQGMRSYALYSSGDNVDRVKVRSCTIKSAVFEGMRVLEGDDWELADTTFVSSPTPFNINYAAVVRFLGRDNKWYGCTNNPSYAAATSPKFQNNINKDGDWWGTTTKIKFLPANEAYTTGTPGGQNYYGDILLANATDQNIQWSYRVPEDFVSFVAVYIVWRAEGFAGGNMFWRMYARYATEGEACDTHSDTPAAGITANSGVLNAWNRQQASNPLTLPNLAEDDYMGLRMDRLATNVADTVEASVRVAGLEFIYIGEDTSTR